MLLVMLPIFEAMFDGLPRRVLTRDTTYPGVIYHIC
jgi:hypothetical protein